MTVISNLMVRVGVDRAGGFALSPGALLHGLAKLAHQPLFDIGIFLYASAAIVWFRVLATENLNTCYPLLVSTTFFLVTLAATLFFREPLTWVKVLGLGIILSGIVLVSRS